ncbi:MAG: fibronectin type III domain-containing protein [Candidatus Aminicenantales bacterium]
MKTIRPMLLLGGFVLVAAACGHKGPIMTPLTREPKRVESVSAAQRGGRVISKWIPSGVFIDDRALTSTARYEIWVLRNSATAPKLTRPAAADEFPKNGELLGVFDFYGLSDKEKEPPAPALASGPAEEFRMERTMTPEEAKAGRLDFGVRVVNGKRDVSDFVWASLKPNKTPIPPTGLSAGVFSDRIEIRWSVPDANTDGTKPPQLKGYNVYRNSPGEEPVLLNIAPAPMPLFNDVSFEFGQRYLYRVAALTGDDAPYVESELSEPIEAAPVDVFPPAAPKGLQSLTAVGLVTLIWDAGTESDLAGYRVWRKTDDENNFRSLTPEILTENTFSDNKIESGRRYAYAVTAVDLTGNESSRSEALSEFIKEDRP